MKPKCDACAKEIVKLQGKIEDLEGRLECFKEPLRAGMEIVGGRHIAERLDRIESLVRQLTPEFLEKRNARLSK